ncbi:MAG: hypothetical protein KKE61_00770, partial [Proteobacteria bacterium]|nr:hypothetical protein [Pseudomonadota bacterium]
MEKRIWLDGDIGFSAATEISGRAAVPCYMEKDRNVLLNFYDFPAEHSRHIRTSNPIESTFATVR